MLLQIKKLKFREVKQFIRNDIARRWLSQNLDYATLKPMMVHGTPFLPIPLTERPSFQPILSLDLPNYFWTSLRDINQPFFL